MDLLAHPDKIPGLIRRGRWDELRTLRDFSVPVELEQKPVMLKLVDRGLAQLFRSGFYARVLEALAKGTNDKVAAAKRRGMANHQALATAEGGSLSLEEATLDASPAPKDRERN